MFFKLTCQDDEFKTHEYCMHAPDWAEGKHALGAAQFRGPDYGLNNESMGVEKISACMFPKHKGFHRQLVEEFTVH